jgi:plasmid stabilization system protein ParE
MAHSLILLPKADADIRRTMRWIESEVSFEASIRWHEKLRTAVRTFSKNPERYPEAYEAEILNLNLRMMLFGKKPHVYRVLYTFTDSHVYIHRVRHAAQDYITEDNI